MMSGLPEQVAEQEIEEMFQFADQDSDGRIGWEEFLLMITPVKMVEAEKPRLMKPAVLRTKEKSVEAEDSKKKVTLDCALAENIGAAEYSERLGEIDISGEQLEMVLRTETDDNAALNNHHNLEDSEAAETQPEETLVEEVGTKEGSSQSDGVKIF